MSTINSSTGSTASGTTSSSRITGMFSSLDTDALVKSMTAIQQSKIDTVKNRQTRQEWYNDTLTGVKDDVNEFMNTYISVTGSSSMLKSAAYATYNTITSSTANAVSLTASSSADVDDISIQINRLATNASATSSGKISKDGTAISTSNTATLGSLSLATPLQFDASGKISFDINGKTFSFTKDTTLQNMINTINTDTTANVTMKYSRLTDGFTITADSGGAASKLSISNRQGNAFGANGAFKIATDSIVKGTDSEAVINKTTVTRDSNEYTIDGITYGLKKVTQGTTEAIVDFSIERDYSATVSAVTKMVDAYNTLFKKLKTLNSETDNSAKYPPLTDAQRAEMTTEQVTSWETKAKSGILRHNGDLEDLMANLKGAFYSSLGGTSKTMADIGITTAGYFDSNSGETILDKEALTEALQNNAEEVIAMFTSGDSTSASSEQGLMYKLKNSITSFTSIIKERMETADDKVSKYDTDISALEDKLDSLADSYYKKFSAMETALSKLNSQASFIGQMFSTNG